MDYSLLLGIHTKAICIKNTGEIPEEYEEENLYVLLLLLLYIIIMILFLFYVEENVLLYLQKIMEVLEQLMNKINHYLRFIF